MRAVTTEPQVRIFVPTGGADELVDRRARGLLTLPDDTLVEVVSLADPPGASSPAELDLLYLPLGRTLDQALGLAFVEAVRSPRAGVITTDGIVIHRGPPSRLATFFRARGAPADAQVYDAGPSIRAAFAQHPGTIAPPRQVYLGLTQKCDRTCDFCVSRTFAFDLLCMVEVDRIIDELQGEVDVIALTGAGEAMMHPDFWAIFGRLRDGFPDATFKMNTSGLSLIRHSDRLLDYPIKSITVSLNATTPETYGSHVGPGLKAVLTGIDRLVDARDRRSAVDVRLCLSMVLMGSTLPELPRMVRLAFELGVEEVQGIYLMIHDGQLASESPWHDQAASNAWLDEAEETGRYLGVMTSLPPRFGATAATSDHQHASLPTSHGHRCTEVFTTAYIRPNGELTPCPYFDTTIGDSRATDSLLAVWHGSAYTGLRRDIVTGDLPAPCRSCAGFSEGGRVDDYASHWLGARGAAGAVPVVLRTR